ncbi:MAG TPA: hypothetical protein VF037_04675 [Gemmatimonadales bacterium]
MKLYEPAAIARDAVAANPTRPAMALAHDHDDGRLVIFRLAPGQAVPSHTSASSVFLSVAAGRGFIAGPAGEVPVQAGTIAAFEPHELHGMRAEAEELIIAALITPRPGTR